MKIIVHGGPEKNNVPDVNWLILPPNCYNLLFFNQGCEGDIDSMITESNTKIAQCLIFLSKLIGEISVKSHIAVVMFKDKSDEIEDAEVSSITNKV